MTYIVYKHTNLVNGKIYIGMTHYSLEERWRSGYRNNRHFWKAIQKYGKENFKHEILAEGLTREEAEEMERRLIQELNTTDSDIGYNIELGGYGEGKHSPETRRKISESQKGRVFTEEHRQHLSDAHKGKKFSPEQIEKLRLKSLGNKSRTGQTIPPETRKKMSEAHRHYRAMTARWIRCSDGRLYKGCDSAAAEYGLSISQVYLNCRGKTKTLTGSNLTFSYI